MNGWDRVPDTLRCRVRVQNYLNRLACLTHSHATVIRLAILMERAGYGTDGFDLHRSLMAYGFENADLGNLVRYELRYREQRRQLEAALNSPTHRLRPDGTLIRRSFPPPEFDLITGRMLDPRK